MGRIGVFNEPDAKLALQVLANRAIDQVLAEDGQFQR
jgi:hypothetical protein